MQGWHAYLSGTAGQGKYPAYFPIYDRHFRPFFGRAPLVMELGVDEGSSLKLWREMFGPDADVVGIDNRPECQKHARPDLARVFIGNQEDIVFLADLIGWLGPPDIVVDDGSHICEHMVASFEYLYPRMSRNGVYLLEDIHAQYYDPGSGRKSFQEYAKAKTDALNAKWSGVPVDAFVRETRSIHFYESVVVFERGRPPLYRGEP